MMSTLIPSSTRRITHVTRVEDIPLGVSIAGHGVDDSLQRTARHAVFSSAKDTFELEGQCRALWGVLRDLAINGFLTGVKNDSIDVSTVGFQYMGHVRSVAVPTIVAGVLSFDSFDEFVAGSDLRLHPFENVYRSHVDFLNQVLQLLTGYYGFFIAFRG